jgi:hypothetical protein
MSFTILPKDLYDFAVHLFDEGGLLLKKNESVIVLLSSLRKANSSSNDPLVFEINQGEPDGYNDQVFVIYRNTSREIVFNPGAATVKAGLYFKEHPMVSGGAAHLTFGIHRFVATEYLGSPALKPYAGQNRIFRDADHDGTADSHEQIQSGKFAVYIHKGGRGPKVGNWSAGCIAIHDGANGGGYETIIEPAIQSAKLHGSIRLLVWRSADFEKFLQERGSMKPTLHYGDDGPWVTKLQNLLQMHGSPDLKADGYFGMVTALALQRFKDAERLADPEVCDTQTWIRLLNR